MKVRLYAPDELNWPMGHHDPNPSYSIDGGGRYGTTVQVDPYPAYAADKALVEELVAECVEAFPLTGAASADLAILSHEFVHRTNAMTYQASVWKRDDGAEWKEPILCPCGCAKMREHHGIAHTIVISGKRIPIMPAMLRYLVAHEYGHAAFHHARRALGWNEGDEEKKLETKYIEQRGGAPDVPARYVGGKWHLSACEIIANDFRLLVMKREVEFWPHLVGRPNGGAERWWNDARAAIDALAVAPPPSA